MRYNIVHLIRGEAKDTHENITKDLVEKFDGFPFHERIAPHFTIKRWFEMDEAGMTQLYKCIEDFVNSHKQSEYSLTGFGHFGKDVIYMGVTPSLEMSRDVLVLMGMLREIKALKFDEFDTGDEFHATLAFSALKPFDYDQVWNYLKTVEQPNFKMKFDNIAVLKKPIDKWVIDRVWEMN